MSALMPLVLTRKGQYRIRALSGHSIDLRVFHSEIHMFPSLLVRLNSQSSTYIRSSMHVQAGLLFLAHISQCLPYVKPFCFAPISSVTPIPFRVEIRYSRHSIIVQQKASFADKYMWGLPVAAGNQSLSFPTIL